MPIDWTTRDRAISFAYLIEASYHDENGLFRMVHWCGPKGRVGSGLSIPVPFYPGQRTIRTPVWEARVTRASMELSMGNIDQTLTAISDLTFNIDIAGGTQASAPVVGDLRRDIVFGRWRNKACRVWLLDLDTGDTQMMGKGSFDRNPSSIGPNTFQVTIDIDPGFPTTMNWPQGRVPLNVDDFTFDSAGSLSHDCIPEQWMLNPDHAGKYIGLNFGNGLIAGDDYVWKEVIPYGRQIRTGTSHWVYAWVSSQKNCFVDDLWWENTNDSNKPIQVLSHSITTFENVDPSAGPLGTCVRFIVTSTAAYSFVWWSPPGGAKSRAVARVSGPSQGQPDAALTEYDNNGSNPVTIYSRTGPSRSSIWEVIEDVITRPELLGLTEVLGTGSITEFRNNVPSMSPASNTNFFAAMACVVPLELTDRPIPVREAFGTLAQFFPFDFAQRYDLSTSDWRVYPVWRSSFTTPPEQVFGVEDMSKTDPPAITQYDNSDGSYANEVIVETPGFYGEPYIASATAASAGETTLTPIKKEKYLHTDPFEQSVAKERDEVVSSLQMKNWLHYGIRGNSSASWTLGEERSQPQRTIQATHGVRSYRVAMGVAIKYDMVGINSDVGMVRKMRYDFDLQQVQITSYHIDHSTRRTKQHGDDVANNTQLDTDVPSVD